MTFMHSASCSFLRMGCFSVVSGRTVTTRNFVDYVVDNVRRQSRFSLGLQVL